MLGIICGSPLCFIVWDTMPDFLTSCASICHHAFPGLDVQSYCFEIIFANISEAELGSANWSLAGVEFSIEDIFGIHPSSIPERWPSHNSCLSFGMANTESMPAISRIVLFVMWSLHIMPRMHLRHHIWKASICYSWCEYSIHVSPAYWSVLSMQVLYTQILECMVNIQLDQIHLLSFDILTVALPMCLFIFVSTVTLFQNINPRCMKLCTTSRSCPQEEIDDSSFTPCPSACVFFRLILNPKHWQTVWNLFIRCCMSSEECDVMATSSRNRNSHRHFIWHLDFTFRLKMLDRLLSEHV